MQPSFEEQGSWASCNLSPPALTCGLKAPPGAGRGCPGGIWVREKGDLGPGKVGLTWLQVTPGSVAYLPRHQLLLCGHRPQGPPCAGHGAMTWTLLMVNPIFSTFSV